MNNKNFYSLGIFFLGLLAAAGLLESIINLYLDDPIYTLKSFANWFLVMNTISLVASLFILKYYHYKKYWFTFSSGTLATIAALCLFIIVYLILITGKFTSYYIPASFVVLGAGIVNALSLIFSSAGKRLWLKTAGISIFIINLVFVSSLLRGMVSGEVQINGTLQKINEWTSLAGSLLPVLFIMHFLSEKRLLKTKNADTPTQTFPESLFGFIGVTTFVFAIVFGLLIAGESKMPGMSSCDFKSPNQRQQKTAEAYDSLLALENTPPIERKLSAPDPSKEAEALYRYLLEIFGKRILSGQMWAPWGYDELKYLQEKTGKQPALRGMDFITQQDNEAEVKHAIDWWNSGGIPTIMWHWGGPGIGEGYEKQ